MDSRSRSMFSLLINRMVLESLDPMYRHRMWDYSTDYYSPFRGIPQLSGDCKCEDPEMDENCGLPEYELLLNVSKFQSSELEVKVTNKTLLIHGKHEEKPDGHGFVKREFVRRYVLPEDVQSHLLTATLSGDGILTITTKNGVPTSESSVSDDKKIEILMVPPSVSLIEEEKSKNCS